MTYREKLKKAKEHKYAKDDLRNAKIEKIYAAEYSAIGLSQALLSASCITGAVILIKNEFSIPVLAAVSGTLAALGGTIALGRISLLNFVKAKGHLKEAKSLKGLALSWIKE